MSDMHKHRGTPKSKAYLVQHLAHDWHGNRQYATPVAELRKWRKDELERAHDELHREPEPDLREMLRESLRAADAKQAEVTP